MYQAWQICKRASRPKRATSAPITSILLLATSTITTSSQGLSLSPSFSTSGGELKNCYTNHKLNDFAATNPSYAYQQHLTFCSSQTTIPSLSLSLSCERNHVGELLPITEEVEVHHLQEDLQASDLGRMRELELSRFNFQMTDHSFTKKMIHFISFVAG